MLVDSPSRRDGMSPEAEKAERESLCSFLHDFGASHNFEKVVILTACVFVQRFFMLQSFMQHERFMVAISALFLAGKVEEHHRKLKDICPKFMDIRKKFGIQSKVPGNDFSNAAHRDDMFDAVVVCERILLNTLYFDLQVTHPHASLSQYLKASKGYVSNKGMQMRLLETARIFIHDSYLTNLCLRFTPEKIALACLYLATCHVRIEPESGGSSGDANTKDWLAVLPSVAPLEEIGVIVNTILDVYEKNFAKLTDPKPDPEHIRQCLRKSGDVARANKTDAHATPTATASSQSGKNHSHLQQQALPSQRPGAPSLTRDPPSRSTGDPPHPPRTVSHHGHGHGHGHDDDDDDDDDDDIPPPPPLPPSAPSLLQAPAAKRARF